jgi:hypothetical protein
LGSLGSFHLLLLPTELGRGVCGRGDDTRHEALANVSCPW